MLGVEWVMARSRRSSGVPKFDAFQHREADSPMRPDVGTQARFKKKKPPQTYRYDSSLAPVLDWDGQNPAREQGEALIAELGQRLERIHEALAADPDNAALRTAAAESLELLRKLKALGRPFLNWAGKAERLSFDVPTLPLFVHERLSTKAIIETLVGHRRERETQQTMFDLFGDPGHPIADQVLRAYEYRDNWVNRMILGDSLVVMNSLLHYEGLGGQVQMIYIDPPYGVKFGSNFQPFVRDRDVTHGDDEDMTREPEMVQAYRDTWELGLHSYLTYLRDRLLLARELLHPSGSIFVQIGDGNAHHVREVMDDIFGADCFIVTILVKKKGSQKSSMIDPVNDYLLWYGKSPREERRTKYHALFEKRELDSETLAEFRTVELQDGKQFPVAAMPTPEGELFDYRLSPRRLFHDYRSARVFRAWPITNGGFRANQMDAIEFSGQKFFPPSGRCWSFRSKREEGEEYSPMERLREVGRLVATATALDGKRYLDDFAYKSISNWWDGLGGAPAPLYVVQTNTEIIQRCLLMTTAPGDLVLDPTCGSGSTAFVAEQWGRRWITIDTSRVPLALARQRLLTATFPYYQLSDETRGPAGGFVYKRRQNSRGEETGGIVPHITLASIANNEPPAEEVLVDRPEVDANITRVTGKFAVEGIIPTTMDWDEGSQSATESAVNGTANGSFADRMLEVLRKSPVLRLEGNRTITLKNVRPPAKTLSLSAEAVVVNGEEQPVAFVFGPENGAVSERLVSEALREAHLKAYGHLYVIGFAIEPNARMLIDSAAKISLPATYVQATPDLMMGDLLKNMRSSTDLQRLRSAGGRSPSHRGRQVPV
jgi:adenine-specific DNA-methyltransferase